MKIQKLFFGVAVLMCCEIGFAQISGINYKAIIKDNDGNLIENTVIQVRFSIIQETGVTTIYVEDHTPTTDENGLVILNIGEGSNVSGNLDIDDFATDNHFLNVQVDTGSGLVDLGTTQLKSVPYAWYAENSGDHLGETWNGSQSLNINSNVDSSGVLNINNTNAFGHGIQINSPGANGIQISTPGDDGVSISNPNRYGVYVFSPNEDGLYVTGALNNGFHVFGAGNNGVEARGANVNGGFFSGIVSGVHAESSDDVNPDIILGGNAGNSNGIISSDPSFESSDVFITSNGDVTVELNQNNTQFDLGQFEIRDGTDFLMFSSSRNGNFLRGSSNGTEARATIDTNPDIILGGQSNTATGDDGIISSSPTFPGSDIFLKSNDAVVVRLDQDNNSNGQFEVRDGENNIVFEVLESGTIRQNGSTIHASDRRLKNNITDLTYGLNEIIQLQPKIYSWNDKEQDRKSIGLIAQEVQPIIKEIVTARDSEERTLGISYTELIPVLINAIKEQNKRIDDLEARLESQQYITNAEKD